MSINEKLFEYIKECPTAYHAVAFTSKKLSDAGYTELLEGEKWNIEKGKGYFVTRNGSSLIAFRIPEKDFYGYMITASHGDSPCFKVKENAEIKDSYYIRLSTEKYGGMLCSSWLDRPLSIAGRITVREKDGFSVKLTDLKEACALIPNVAIHMNRNANDGVSYNPAVDMLPLYGTDSEKYSLKQRIAENVGTDENDIITTDLFLYNPQNGTEWNSLLSAPRLDDLQCAFSALTAFIQTCGSTEGKFSAPVYCLLDNEEVGSQTKQGAASTFIFDTLEMINLSFGGDTAFLKEKFANSFLVSCDNAHAIHPNHPEYSDKNHTVRINGGIVVKYNANQKYTTDAVSCAVFRLLCEKSGVPVQLYANRADMPGGSTLGSIANTQVSVSTVDIGLAQLAMHSSYETAGAEDTGYLIKALTAFYSHSVIADRNGGYKLI